MATGGRESDEIVNIKCSICAKKEWTREAEKYCTACNEYYCSSCVDLHSLFSSMTQHEVLDKADFGSRGTDTSLPRFPTQRCTLHSGKIVDMFCKDHNEVACATCIALNHRSCTNICYVPEEVNSLYNEEMANSRQRLCTIKKSMEEIKKIVENKLEKLKNSLDEAVVSVKVFATEIKQLIDKLELQSIHELKAEFNRVEQCLKADLDKAEKIINSIDEIALRLRKSEGNVAEEFVCVKSSQKATLMAEQIVQKTGERQTDETVFFKMDKNIIAFLHDFKTLGEASSSKPLEPKTSLYKVKRLGEVNIKVPGDIQTCNIYGSCITEDGYLLLADNLNKKLKRVDMSCETVKDFYVFQASPYAVFQVNKAEAAVTLDNKSVQFVTLADTLTVNRTLTLDHDCMGLVHSRGRLIISDKSTNVFIHNKDGQQLQKITPTNFLESTYHIALSDAGDKIFVADWKKGLVILDTKGSHLSTVTTPSVSSYHGVCTDGSNVFVCGYNSHNIVQIGKDYKLMGEIAKVKNPLSLSLDRQNSRLTVTSFGDKITILDLE